MSEFSKNEIVVICFRGIVLGFGDVIDASQTIVTVIPRENWMADPIVFTKRKSGKWIAKGDARKAGPEIEELPF